MSGDRITPVHAQSGVDGEQSGVGIEEHDHAPPEDPRELVENAPIALQWLAANGTILWANRAELDLLGYDEQEYVGRSLIDFFVVRGEAQPFLERIARGEEVHGLQARLRTRGGDTKYVLISANARWRDGEVEHVRCFVTDVSGRRLADRADGIRVGRSEPLKAITSAIGDAVTAEQVYEAVVDQVAEALGASSSALLLAQPETGAAQLVRANGYSPSAQAMLASTAIDGATGFPLLDVLRSGEPLWMTGPDEILRLYPNLAPVMTSGRSYSAACVPLLSQGRILGALAFTFEDGRGPLTEDDKSFLLLTARHSGQALERLRLFAAERQGRARAEILYGLARAVIGAHQVEEVFEAALDAIRLGLDTDRASILAFDGVGVMRFRAWRNLSDEYRRAVEGHSPWTKDARDPQPIVSGDVEGDPAMASYLTLFRREKIGALTFVPLVTGGRLVGKFMVYYPSRRELGSQQMDLARAIANHVAAAIARFQSVAELQETVRFNEMFNGILGHDLRNPLAAISTSAHLATTRSADEKIRKPLSRIINCSARMSRMIDQLLDFTRIRAVGGIPVNRSPQDLIPIVRQSIDELDDANPDWTFHFEQRGDANGAWDSDRLSQVFSNLIANAVQHGLAEQGLIVSVDGSAADDVVIEVRNAGVIRPERLARLFEPLAGGRSHERAAREGLGLGLYITRELVWAHGGRIDVTSDEEHGTTFRVALPRVARSS